MRIEKHWRGGLNDSVVCVDTGLVVQVLVNMGIPAAVELCSDVYEETLELDKRLVLTDFVLSHASDHLSVERKTLWESRRNGLHLLMMLPQHMHAKSVHLAGKFQCIVESLIMSGDTALLFNIFEKIPALRVCFTLVESFADVLGMLVTAGCPG